MAPKSERFELRLDESQLSRIAHWAEMEGNGMSRAEAVRELVNIGLDASSRHSAKLTDGEKLIIAMIADLGRSEDRREIDTNRILEAIYGGHLWALKWDHPWLLNDYQDTPGAVSFVVDVLDMWSFIESAWKRFSEEEQRLVADELGYSDPIIEFSGFDGHTEGTYIGIARHLIENMGRFSGFKGRDFDSHIPKSGRYTRMLRMFEPMRRNLDGTHLSVDEIVALLKREPQ